MLQFRGGEWRKWMVLVATIWIQAFTGTNFDFSSYSSDLKSVLGITQVQLNYLSVASDLGKAFGWCSGVILMHFPLWTVMFMAAFMGLFGYGFQWLIIQRIISLPYFLVFLLSLLAGCSICWFNTFCYISCIRNFPTNQSLALSLTVSFNGLSAALYTLIANSINPNDNTLYLFLNALLPIFISGWAFIPIFHQASNPIPPSSHSIRQDSLVFICLNVLAVITGFYLLLLNSLSYDASTARVLLMGAFVLLALPLCFPGIEYVREWWTCFINMRICLNDSSEKLIELDALDQFHEEEFGRNGITDSSPYAAVLNKEEGCLGKMMMKDRLMVLHEEHPARLLVRRLDFWLYYAAYFCGGTIGLVYSNNLGQISQSLGYGSLISSLVTLYSSCSFFGRLMSAAPDFLLNKVYIARTGWLVMALVPTPIALIFLATSGSEAALRIGTGLIGLSSGFVSSAAVSISSELFGPKSAGVNHNILIINIPIGSFLYGLLAAIVYDSNAKNSEEIILSGDRMVCMGRKCYLQTFVWWGCISLLGLVSSFLLFRRTKLLYGRLS